MTIVERIAKRISEIFPNVTIYSEKQKSGFQVPSFYISKIMTVTKSRFFDIQDRSLSYSLTYFANPDRPNADMDEVEQKLLNNFTRLDDYATVRNRETTINQDDETLVMSFDLRLEMYPVQDGGKLERVEFNGGIQ
ncbi:phage tail terminator family protein [Lactobacillus gasseri]